MQRLSDEDIEKIVRALREEREKCPLQNCRFPHVDPEALEESVKFYKNFNSIFNKTGSIIWTTLLVGGIGGVVSLIWLGLAAKIRALFP